jgi:hypothetical protein
MSVEEPETKEIRHLDITDLERIERFRRAGYGGAVSDALYFLGVRDTVLSDRFKPLRQGMQLVAALCPSSCTRRLSTIGARLEGRDGEKVGGRGGHRKSA